MRSNSRFHLGWVLLLLLLTVGSQMGATAQSNNSLAKVLASDGRFSAFNAQVRTAGLTDLLSNNNSLTVFVPSNWLVQQAGSAETTQAARQFVLMHSVFGKYDTEAITGQTQLKNGFGQMIRIDKSNGLKLNGKAAIIVGNIPASNGVIHIVDALLVEPVAAEEEAEPANQYARAEKPPVTIGNPNQNPAYVSGSLMTYRNGIMSGAYQCRGMTWTMHEQRGGVTRVGSDRKTNPYRGDTPCNGALPLLCLQRTNAGPPGHARDGWAFGSVKATTPVRGTELSSRQRANEICAEAYGVGWRMAEFHDAQMGSAIGWVSGHDMWASGSLPLSERFWVAIEDQAANPWNSQVGGQGLPGGSGLGASAPGADPAYIGEHPLRMSEGSGRSQGRNGCQGMTWVIHRQIDNKVQVGADLSSNPFVGDRSCHEVHHILCIRVDGLRPPGTQNGFDFSHGWSGGTVGLSRPVSGHQMNERGKANQVCQDQYGPSWRMATFHDGALGRNNTDGWEFWAYGRLPVGRRFWVATNDQPSNPWNRNR
ncbi:MAG: fasciclin domain-containing protein [Candidatus Promineifilaceae bacterium]